MPRGRCSQAGLGCQPDPRLLRHRGSAASAWQNEPSTVTYGSGDRAWAFEQGAGSPLMVTGALRGRGQLPIGRAQPRYGWPLSWGDPTTTYWLTG